MGLTGSIFAICVALASLLAYVARRVGSRMELRGLRRHAQPVRRITEAEREAVRAAFGVDVAIDAPVFRIEGVAYEHQLVMNGQPILHYLIGSVEIKPFRDWETFIAPHNVCEVVLGPRAALPLRLNHAALPAVAAEQVRQMRMDARLRHARSGVALEPTGEDDGAPPATLGSSRQETPAEAALRTAWAGSASGWALLLGLGGIALAVVPALQSSDQTFLAIPALACMACGAILLYLRLARPARRPAQIRTLRGMLVLDASDGRGKPAPWHQARIGGMEVRYPAHWLPHLAGRDGQACEVDLDLNHEVVRHDRLSLYEERRRFPVQRWGWHLALLTAAAAMLALSLQTAWPLGDTLSRAAAILHVRTLEASTPTALLAQQPRPWDRLVLSGTADCLPTADADDMESAVAGNARSSLGCHRLGWREQPIDLSSYRLPADLQALQAFVEKIRPLPGADLPPSPRLHNGDPRQEATLALLDMPGLPVRLDDFAQHLLELDRVCAQRKDDACASLRDSIAALAGHEGDWPGAVAQAQADGHAMPDVRIPPHDARVLTDRFDELLAPAIRQARLALWRKASAAAPPALVLQTESDIMPGSLTEQAREDALSGLMGLEFWFEGTVALLSDSGTGPPVLIVREEARPYRLVDTLAPLLIGALALLCLSLNGLALWRMQHRREARRMAVEAYVKDQLD